MVLVIKSVVLSTGATLQYGEQGLPSGIPIVLLHGLADSWHSYELLLPYIPASIHAFALTQRGHGDSKCTIDSYRLSDFTTDLAAFLDTLHLEKVVVVGHSLGSAIAQRFAIDHPRRTQGLVLVGSFANMANSSLVQGLWDDMISTLEDSADPGFIREFQESTLATPVPQTFMETMIQESLKLPARVWKGAVAGALQDDFSRELSKIKVPTLLVWGDQDGMVPRSDQEAQMAAIPDSRLLVYQGTGHAVFWEEPERFASDLTGFIKTVR